MAKLSYLKQSIVDSLLITIRKEKTNMKNSNYERRMFLMVETALAGGETAFAESILLNFLGKVDLAKTLTWVNQPVKKDRMKWEKIKKILL